MAQQTASPTTSKTAARPRMPLRQAIGQHMVFAYSGTTPPRALKRRIARGEAAGVILSARNVCSVASLHRQMAALQAIHNRVGPDAEFHPLLVMVAQEGGRVRQLPGGRDPAVVAERAAWFAGGLRSHGILPVYSHFPGLGAATIGAPERVDVPLSKLRAIDLRVYTKLWPDAVMASTAIYPRVDPRPAAFSRRWITDELRERLDYGNIVVLTDDLQAPWLAKYGSPAQLAVQALRAGVDMPVFAQDYATGARAAEGLERAVRSGSLKPADVEAGAQRVLHWRESLVVGDGP